MNVVKQAYELLTFEPRKVEGTDVMFCDMWKLFRDAALLKQISKFYEQLVSAGDVVVAMATRGIPLATLIAANTGAALEIATKPSGGKRTDMVQENYKREYGELQTIELSIDTVRVNGQRVWIVDDLIATGGTIDACISLVTRHCSNQGVIGGVIALVDLGISTSKHRVHYKPLIVVNQKGEFQSVGPNLVADLPINTFMVPIPIEADQTIFMMTSHPSMYEFAVKSNLSLPYIPVCFDKFPDGTPNFSFSYKHFFGKRVVYYMNGSYETLLDEIQMIRVLSDVAHSMVVIWMYNPYATNERIDDCNNIASAKTIAALFKSLKRPIVLKMVDLHYSGVKFLHDNGKIEPYEYESYMEKFATQIIESNNKFIKEGKGSTWIVYPDEGALKRFKPLFGNLQYVYFSKQRLGEQRKVTLKGMGNSHSADDIKMARSVIIIDDLTRTLGTLIETRQALIDHFGLDPSIISAFVVHLDIVNGAENKLLPLNFKIRACYTNPVKCLKLRRHACISFYNQPAEHVSFAIVTSANKTKQSFAAKHEFGNRRRLLAYHPIITDQSRNQPFGPERGLQCARERYLQARITVNSIWDKRFYFLSVENFMGIDDEQKEKTYYDQAVALVVDDRLNVAIAYGTKTPIDECFATASIESGFKKTAGSLMQKHYNFDNPDDWYSLYGTTRDETFQPLNIVFNATEARVNTDITN